MSIFNLPDLGEGLSDAEIVSWHVSEGDHVITEQPLLAVETDKAVVEIPAPFSGIVKTLIAQTGEIVPIGGALVDIETGGGEDKGAIVGELETAEKAPRPAAPARPEKPAQAGIHASPAVRRLARARNVDLARIAGSGPGGAILSSDVMAATARLEIGEELRGVRRSMARAMARSLTEVVPATIMDEAVITHWRSGEEPTLRLIRAIITACRAEPALNAWFDGSWWQKHDHVDLAIAMDTPDGLFAPVLTDADSEADIAARLAALKAKVKDRSIQPDALKGATITLSNFGMLGGQHAVLVVTPPQVAILGAGRIAEKMVVTEGQASPGRVLPLSLTFDHRVVTGGEAARFIAALREDLERP